MLRPEDQNSSSSQDIAAAATTSTSFLRAWSPGDRVDRCVGAAGEHRRDGLRTSHGVGLALHHADRHGDVGEFAGPALLRLARRVQGERQRQHAGGTLRRRGPAGDPGAGAPAAEHQWPR